MNRFFSNLFSIVTILTLTSCAGSAVRPPSYAYGGKSGSRPDAERVPTIDTKQPIGYVWSRWEEEPKSRIIVNSGDVISSRHIAKILESSQNAEVNARLNSYKKWSTVGTYSSLLLALGAVSTGIGYIRKNDGGTSLSISTINILWGISALALGTTVFSLMQQDIYLNEAVEAYNAQARPNNLHVPMGEKKASLDWSFAF